MSKIKAEWAQFTGLSGITCCTDWYEDFHVSDDTGGSSCRQLL